MVESLSWEVVHAFEVTVISMVEVPNKSQSERVDEATKTIKVMSASAPTLSHSATTCRIKKRLLWVILVV